jgi:hypothetical protein
MRLFSLKSFQVRGLAVLALTVSLTSAARAATFGSLAQRLPAGTDAIVAIDVENILNSPYAKEQKWRETMSENWAKRPQVVPPGVKKLLMGAEFVPSKAETHWEVVLMDMEKVPSAKDLVAADGGTIDRVWNIDAAVAPSNAYFVPLDARTLAVCSPGERSMVSKWVRQPAKDDQVTSKYIKSSLSKLEAETGVMMALDLEGAFSLPKIRRYLENAELEELKGQNLDTIAQVLGSMQGLRVYVTAGAGLSGRIVIDFARDTRVLSKGAKPLLISVMKHAGMYLQDLENWTYFVEGTEVRAAGPLTDASFQALIGLVQSPVPSAVAVQHAAAGGTAAGGAAGASLDPAVASQRYFKAVSQTIDNLGTGGSMGETSTYWFQAAGRIDKLPILNVDPALLDWGNSISMKLKQLAGGGKVGQNAINTSVAGVASIRVDTSYWDKDENYHYRSHEDPETARQRRQAALAQKTELQKQALQILGEANGTRQKIRQEMTAKYNVES